jgi:hypothetical protein
MTDHEHDEHPGLADARRQADYLRSQGFTYEQAVERLNYNSGTLDVDPTWPLIAEQLADDGYSWPQICQITGLNKLQAVEQLKREFDENNQTLTKETNYSPKPSGANPTASTAKTPSSPS